ncbi:MAG: PilZ domain-containing protein [Phenylobacterium sp.]|uniref:PilZ domain-containing protein n=1 Tax=Phenylobacterium sp. TaxID=1871053 RepID=UPI0027361AF6|nr:PilZ domain-containing protein [Phenylobacterium sp.]MDP3746407.1 PilZ domain-containing protein [Phenylobacterium sp.]
MVQRPPPPAQAIDAERREELRRRVFLTGILIHGPAKLTVDCTIRDLTDSGARVRLGAPDDLSQPLMLLICRSGDAFAGEIAWRRGDEIGLSFSRQCDLNAPLTGRAKTGRRLWIERSAR